MHRRRYLAGVGAGLGTLPAARAGANAVGQGGEFGRIRPTESSAIRPETTVLFEASVPEGAEPTDVGWETDADSDSLLGTEYAFATGNAARSPTFASVGTYDVRASYGGESLDWTVTVTDDAPEPPVVEEVWTEPADETVGVGDVVDVTATVADPAGDLAGVVWTEGRNMTVYDVESVGGDRGTATLSVEGGSHWLSAGYPTVVRAVAADGRLSDPESADGPAVRQPFEVEILGTNAPVAAGEDLAVEVEVTHVGDMMMVGPNEQEIRLVVGDETVDAETLAIDWNESEEFTLGYETYPVERDVEFPVRVECEDDADETTVSVYADEPSLSVSIEDTNAPVTTGEELWIDATVANGGSAEATEEVAMVVGGETVDRQSVTIAGGDEERVTLSYVTAEVRQDVEFPIEIEGEHDSDAITVSVYADEAGDREGELGVSITTTNAPVTGGEHLSVQVSVGNDATADASEVVELVVGGKVVDSRTVNVPGEATQTIELGYETYPVRQDVTVDLTVRSEHDEDRESVPVYGTGG